ncbi:hypothetical protein M413DRAFT_443809 [Hebeloma cylindrosporum]|uniref:Ubiquitin 3 binding protein But2 C-terminal domain-containing protein n=1 Tax=Hebeloma cylindrosporum TaxID=76867 RepID=A0A0C2YPM1_HEBCY|nr:hypothetical protein M413DRAFT_443809 [Hebeloma cylindrosporum h7]
MLIIHTQSIPLLVLLLVTPFVVASTSHYTPRKRVVLNRVLNRVDVPINEGVLTTNAARMRVGLGPIRPRSLDIPSRVKARTPKSSPLPPITNVRIKVRRQSDNACYGYLSKVKISEGPTLVTNGTDVLKVKFTPTCEGEETFNIAIDCATYPWLGFAGPNLNPKSATSATMVATKSTPPGSCPVRVGNALSSKYPNSESSVWSYDKITKRLSAQWINSDKSKPKGYFWYFPSNKTVGLVSSLTANSKDGFHAYLEVAAY